MKVAFFDTHAFDRRAFELANQHFGHDITFVEPKLGRESASIARGYDAVCAFVNDRLDRETLGLLKEGGVKIVALRSAGFNNVDLSAARDMGLTVVRVPEYSPFAVAEHVVALIQTLNRKIHRAFNRVREGNFSLNGLVGFDLHNKTVGILGVGKIGKVLARILTGFGCEVLLYDKYPEMEFAKTIEGRFTDLDEIFRRSDIISLNLPLTKETRYLIDQRAISSMKKGVMIINTGRGALIDTKALIEGLKSGAIGAAGLDVYEEEEKIFFQDLSDEILSDDTLARLLTFPNVLITGHQAFLTHEALANIAETTLNSLKAFERGEKLFTEVKEK
jgi:D-lactate dehydrogenase